MSELGRSGLVYVVRVWLALSPDPEKGLGVRLGYSHSYSGSSGENGTAEIGYVTPLDPVTKS